MKCWRQILSWDVRELWDFEVGERVRMLDVPAGMRTWGYAPDRNVFTVPVGSEGVVTHPSYIEYVSVRWDIDPRTDWLVNYNSIARI